ncbi:MAG: NADP(H)-dependent aldo-keto reductase [Gammaproteobacteria bacterium]
MEYRQLGQTEIRVSLLCLGSMTWGGQNTEAEAHEQLDHAVDAGINFIDTAEMYPFPVDSGNFGQTETIIGNWLKKRNDRDRLVIATKIAPASDNLSFLRDGNNRLDRKNIEQAVNDSLKRLNTDYIDLYQTHWPERQANFFGKLDYKHSAEGDCTPIEETLAALDDMVRAGKIRYIGVSNETPWGVAEHLRIAAGAARPRIVSIQNPYNLLNRIFEVGLAEFAHREQVGLLAYSPLAFGTLSGKYLENTQPQDARLTLYPNFQRYLKPNGVRATEQYCLLAREHGLDPAQMALAFINSRPFVTSNIIGARTMAQLRSNIESMNIMLPDDLVEAINAVHADNPNPCP